jgi:hypothetical protein
MKYLPLTLSVRSTLVVGVASLLLTGCLTKNEEPSYNSDGQSAYMTSELDQMGQIYDGGAGAATKTSSGGLTLTGELIIKPYAFTEACMCFVREAKLTTVEGYERMRIDSVVLLDSTGAKLVTFEPARIAKMIHSRNVTKTKGGNEADIRFDMTVDIKTDGGLKVGVWNGVMTGSYNGQALKGGTLTNVTRPWENGRFRFPTSGQIDLDRPVFHFQADFLGDGKAKFTITNKVNHKIHILFVDKEYKESEAMAGA